MIVNKPKVVRAPKGLSAAGAGLWRKLQVAYGVEDEGGLAILEVACRSFGTMLDAEAILARDGLVVEGERGVKKAHPAAAIGRDARSGMLQAFKQLGFAPGDK